MKTPICTLENFTLSLLVFTENITYVPLTVCTVRIIPSRWWKDELENILEII